MKVADAAQHVRGGGRTVGAGSQNDRDPRHRGEVEVDGGLPGVQGPGQSPGGAGEFVGKFQ